MKRPIPISIEHEYKYYVKNLNFQVNYDKLLF
jgi:hypothetical protein